METQEKNIHKKNKEEILSYIEVNPGDIAVVDYTVRQLIMMGVGSINSIVILESDTRGWEILLTDDIGKVFFLQLNSYGGIEQLRKDNSRGEVIHAALYD